MSKFGGFLTRKPGPAAQTAASAATSDNPLDLDEELFSALGAQLGGENEALRNLLLDANAKIGELDTIKSAVGNLVDPVTKALRAFEAEKTEKANLQAVLNNTRTAYGKLKNELGDLEKKATAFETECNQLRQDLTATKYSLRAIEATKAELAIDISARRAQIADLESRLQRETGEAKALRDENKRLDERAVASDKRIVALEAELNSARQRLIQNEDEKRALQSSLDQTIAESARVSRRLAETESSLSATHSRLRQVEANFAEVSTERSRLATTLEETNERHESELATQRMRFEALQARAGATEKLLGEARDHLAARAEEIRGFDRRFIEVTLERDNLAKRVAGLESERIHNESERTELEQARATLLERGGALTRAYNSKESELARANETIESLNDRIGFLETQLHSSRQTAEQEIEELNAALRREKHERAVVEGALETGRKDFARLMREVMELQRRQAALDPDIEPRAANAA